MKKIPKLIETKKIEKGVFYMSPQLNTVLKEYLKNSDQMLSTYVTNLILDDLREKKVVK